MSVQGCCRGAQIVGSMSPEPRDFIQWGLTILGPQYGSLCFHFCGDSKRVMYRSQITLKTLFVDVSVEVASSIYMVVREELLLFRTTTVKKVLIDVSEGLVSAIFRVTFILKTVTRTLPPSLLSSINNFRIATAPCLQITSVYTQKAQKVQVQCCVFNDDDCFTYLVLFLWQQNLL